LSFGAGSAGGEVYTPPQCLAPRWWAGIRPSGEAYGPPAMYLRKGSAGEERLRLKNREQLHEGCMPKQQHFKAACAAIAEKRSSCTR